jgi:DNA-binding response OmpR family regulator
MEQFRILLLEDDPLISLQMGLALEEWGYSVFSVCKPEEALKRLEKDVPDVLILNFCFGRGCSEKISLLLEQILLRRQEVLVVTGVRREDIHSSLNEAGNIPVLFKPFTRYQLREQVRLLVSRRGRL